MNKNLRFLAALACLMSAGCASPDVNLSSPRATTGYVDFYTDDCLDLSWRVKWASDPNVELKPVFTKLQPLPGNILRLAAPAGTNQFELWINNRATTGPQTVVVPVANAKLTPVHVTLRPVGESAISTPSYAYRTTGRGTRHVTQTTTQAQQTLQIGVVSDVPRDYQPKERMPYFREPQN